MNRALIVALVLPILATVLQWLLWPWLTPFIWFFFFPAVFFSARYGGVQNALISSLLSVCLAWFFFISPQLSWAVDQPSNLYSLGLFLVMSYLIGDAQE
ncbi:MAG: DUF4118 domain-containing protein [Methylococcaceae bacterium]|nr:DUF4118 domain-containing protein [Methylococcaceae bacterium]MDZ4156168.1 DUF4118 domain-containing protein [Methylococcales bacterium]MDP2393746.1 DUF4118 domain-containing protein [Methylococcaceae bacterium]MDP3019772.1 DUF4118 domain-containing protein [Methylococcaceae bacterium]MDP3389623.1 DUF4118 domain-containing protein [Methylococcaceae bacterium]